MKKIVLLQKIFRPTPIYLCLLTVMLTYLALKHFGIISITLTRHPQEGPTQIIRKNVAGVSTRSAVLKGSISTPTPAPTIQKASGNIPQGIGDEMTVSCVIDANCGGGEKILAQSACENSVCCYENGQYIQYWDRKSCGDAAKLPQNTPEPVINNYTYPIYIEETYTQPVRNYDSLYIKSIGLTYSCLDTRHTEILLAEQDYLNEMKEVSEICARNDTSIYVDCVNKCDTMNYTECEKKCYSEIDWKCSVNMTDSPEYRDLEHLLYMYCK